ncbi:MAG: HlyD family efflux transporter periplasmic adaptor subunit [Catenulisporales bacterium]|nr:HlyD family efflux transporter periplasmic adaptor subunit [Catenulisporales bacterium]
MTDSPRLPKGVWINTSLAVVVAAGGAGAWVLLGDSSPSKAATGRTVAVQRGDVTAQVSASGNVTLPTEDDLAFTASGTVTEVDVKAGDHVKAGQVLAKIDPTQANQQLTAAQAQLTTAQAQLTKLQQGQTPQQAALSAQQLKSAGDSLAAAKTAYADAQNSISVDASNLQTAVNTAKSTLSADQATQAADCAAPAKATCAADGNKVTQDQNALTQAENAQKTGAQKDTQSLHQAQNSLTQAQNSYNTAVDQQAVSTAPATPDQLAQANQAIVTAQNAVAGAQKAVAGTTITAPQAGTVLSVGGTVGDVVSAGAAASSSAPASSSASGSSGGASGGSSGGASAASASSSSSKFIVLGDMTALTVRAEFAETDAAKLKAGEAAQVTINAIPGSALTATVQSVDPTATVVSNVVEYGVTLQFTTGQQDLAALKPGQTASVSVVTGKVTNVLYVPSSSVTKAGGQSLVTVVNGSTKTPTPVQVGVVGDATTEITSGLNEGDQVLLSSRTGTTSSGGTRGGFGGAGGAGGAGGLGGLGGGKAVVGP